MSIDHSQNEIEFVLRNARESDVKFIRLWFTDILGNLKGFAITIEDLEDALLHGVGFDGAAIEGFARDNESDVRAFPDPSTFAILPWRPKDNATARMFCDIHTPQGEPFPGDPRTILKHNLEQLAKSGFTYYVGTELEFFYFENDVSPILVDKDGYFDQNSGQVSGDLRRDTVLNLAQMGIPVKYSHHEVAPSQNEIDLQYTDALSMADNVVTAKLVIKELALAKGVYATFMPKPISGINGSGMHTYQSLFKGENNAFYSDNDPFHLSQDAKYFVAGLLTHAPEITLVTNQWINSYKRLASGHEAPKYLSWAHLNKSDLIRIPAFKTGGQNAVRIEYRAPDPACNPYLAFSVMLAAGLKGIEGKYDLVEPGKPEISNMVVHNVSKLPSSLEQAILLAENSELLKTTLGENIFDRFILNKKIELDLYQKEVTDFEINRYLSML
ncbi:MAG: glutamine synthetase family protein [Dehalococcoidia bacterium]